MAQNSKIQKEIDVERFWEIERSALTLTKPAGAPACPEHIFVNRKGGALWSIPKQVKSGRGDPWIVNTPSELVVDGSLPISEY
ncbi:hypothetical protein M8J75_010544 [Diaphorina citri]|nr:hypothetical protein M8J75_010544 [Diaphorina citri]